MHFQGALASALSALLGMALAQERPRGGGPRRIPAGTWAGSQMAMTVSEDGADVEYGCGRGRIRGPLALDAEGRFDLKGTHVQEQPGPEREGQEPGSRPARYKGQIKGKTMTVTVSLADARESLGPFTLSYGRPPVLRKCQ